MLIIDEIKKVKERLAIAEIYFNNATEREDVEVAALRIQAEEKALNRLYQLAKQNTNVQQI